MRHRHGRLTAALLALGASWGPAPAWAQDAPLTLARAAELALARHPVLQSARAARDGARAGVRLASAPLWPQVRAEASALRFQEPMVVAPLHGLNPQEPPLFDRTLIQLQVGLSYTLWDGGQRRAGIGAALAGVTGGDAAVTRAAAEIVEEVAGAWLAVAAGREMLRAEDARWMALELESRRVRQFLEVGRAAEIERLRIEAALAHADADRIARREELQVAEAALARLLDLPAAAVQAAAIVPVAVRTALPGDEEVRRGALAENPELAQARARVLAAAAATRAARGGWWPEVRVVAGYTDYSSGDGRLTGEWQAGVRAGYALFSGGAKGASQRRADAELLAARADQEAVERRVHRAIDVALAEARSAAARVEALASAVAQSAEVSRIERLALDAGAGTQSDWIRAEADLLAVRTAQIAARQALVRARVGLARLSGSLDIPTLITLVESDA